jgi:hypothetical protein
MRSGAAVNLCLCLGVLNTTVPLSAQQGGQRGRRLWAGRVPEHGAYRVEVVRRGAYCDPAVNDQLTVSLE